MSRVLACLALCGCVLAPASSAADLHALPHELWDRPRSGPAVLTQPAVRQAVSQYLAEPGSRLVIHHGLGQESLLQAEELRMWLMSLAVEGARIGLASDLKQNEPLKIEVVR